MGAGASIESSDILSNSKFMGSTSLSWKRNHSSLLDTSKHQLFSMERDHAVNMDLFDCVATITRQHLIGTHNRWDHILAKVNKAIAKSKVESLSSYGSIDQESLREIMLHLYKSVPPLKKAEISRMERIMPTLFDKHSYARGKRVSQQERNDRCLLDESYSYGEISQETFATIFFRHQRLYGYHQDATFCDLGSGVGTLVYTAAIIGSFKKCLGIENIRSLHIRAEKRLPRWNKLIQVNQDEDLKNVDFEFRCKDMFHDDTWVSYSFIFLHWTAFNLRQRKVLANMMNDCKEGTTVITFTHPVPNPSFIVLAADKCETSWGIAHYFIQEKL